jgi:catechol 2,3-dioxygenase-like lactoylglutathione lyase family enzyme
MKVRGIRWVGVKTRDFPRLSRFFRQVMGLSPVLERPDFVVFTLPNGDTFELFGPSGPDPPEQFRSNPVVCGFLVDDIERGRRELTAAGIELLGPVQYSSSKDGSAWQHFRGPDGIVYELCQDPKRV